LEPGAGGFSPVWSLVQPAVAQFARVVAYDRAGYARSDASPVSTPRTADQTVLELHRLLHNADLQPPYILVDHSFGGFVTRLFAHRFPDEVADLVLVDADHEDEWT
jgi:pimeloyl-ACP methyl ester carboxylesterase